MTVDLGIPSTEHVNSALENISELLLSSTVFINDITTMVNAVNEAVEKTHADFVKTDEVFEALQDLVARAQSDTNEGAEDGYTEEFAGTVLDAVASLVDAVLAKN